MKKLFVSAISILLLTFLAACTSNGEEGKDAENEHGEHTEASETNGDVSSELLVASTKNVTRLHADTLNDAAIMVSQTIWPATGSDNRPGTVILAPADQWQIALAGADLIHHPNNGPVLFYNQELSEETLNEINRLNPTGNANGTEVMVMGDATEKVLGSLQDYKVEQITGKDAAEFALAVDKKYAETAGELPQSVIIVSLEDEAKLFSLIASNWIAHMPEPILFVSKDDIPKATVEALKSRGNKANIYVLAPEEVISEGVVTSLKEYGNVTRIEGENPVEASIAFAKFKDEKTGFGWGVTEPGHGFAFTTTAKPEFAIAGAPFAHLGKHAPLIWLEDGEATSAVHEYLAALQPKFTNDPTVGPYNHGYILANLDEVSMDTQGMIDSMLEISPAEGSGGHGSH
ncbi:ArsR family transcriptional regulator [Robertmurraya korlensis]|uniref:ArsR family transcriptional regulator n=1 Tax=Robertmurraya korlensis TaxID=519977 RepID=UPI000824DA2B|nr:ArsR family transcriptional regulator [Robertmurraya korlensis]